MIFLKTHCYFFHHLQLERLKSASIACSSHKEKSDGMNIPVSENNDCVKKDSSSCTMKDGDDFCSSSESDIGEEEDPILWTNNKFSALIKKK